MNAMAIDYTVQVDMETVEGDWMPAYRANLTDERDPDSLADWVADERVVRDGADWRVRIWLGHDVDVDTDPVIQMVVNEYEP
jgi:hypothetical protein